MTPRIYAIVTAYNEADLIGATLDALASAFPGVRLIVGDDGSSDATAQIAREAGARVVRSERVIGKGGAASLAALAALREAAERRGEGDARGAGEEAIFVLCDGDLGASARELTALTGAIERGETDLAVACFATRAGGGFGLALGFARWAIRRRCGLRTVAPISGQRALGESALSAVLPFARGFGMEVGMTIDAVRAGYRVAELRLELSHRASGRTLGGFVHRAGQLVDFARVYVARGRLAQR
jgi:glycosyltransferase involved in cell wall biosynthesis